MKNKYATYGIIAIAIIVVLVLLYAFTSKRTITTEQGQTTTTQGGLGELIASIFGGGGSSGSGSSSGGGIAGWLSSIFGSKPKPTKYCDCNRPGYALDGNLDSLCDVGKTQYEIDCLK